MNCAALLQTKAIAHEPLQAWAIDEIVGQLFVGEHGKRGTAAVSDHLGRGFIGERAVLCDDGHHHVHHELKAAKILFFLLLLEHGACFFRLCVARVPGFL